MVLTCSEYIYIESVFSGVLCHLNAVRAERHRQKRGLSVHDHSIACLQVSVYGIAFFEVYEVTNYLVLAAVFLLNHLGAGIYSRSIIERGE